MASSGSHGEKSWQEEALVPTPGAYDPVGNNP